MSAPGSDSLPAWVMSGSKFFRHRHGGGITNVQQQHSRNRTDRAVWILNVRSPWQCGARASHAYSSKLHAINSPPQSSVSSCGWTRWVGEWKKDVATTFGGRGESMWTEKIRSLCEKCQQHAARTSAPWLMKISAGHGKEGEGGQKKKPVSEIFASDMLMRQAPKDRTLFCRYWRKMMRRHSVNTEVERNQTVGQKKRKPWW